MWVVKVSDFLEMVHPFPSHEELRSNGKLYDRQEHMYCIFVSHQWTGHETPDPFGFQLVTLQQVLRNICYGSLHVSMDTASQFQGDSHVLSEKERLKLRDAYIWMDWFSIPQVQTEVEAMRTESTGINEDSDAVLTSVYSDHSSRERAICTRSCSPALSMRTFSSVSAQDVMIQSISNFVQESAVFIILAPPLRHEDTGEICDYKSWLKRGWCRAEMWCYMLSDLGQGAPVVLVNAADQAEFVTPGNWVDALPLEGNFTVEEDRKDIAHMLRVLLRSKLHSLLLAGKLDLHRFFTARREALLGRESRTRSLSTFMADFHLTNSTKQEGLGAVACAVLSGDSDLVTTLSAAGYPVDAPVRKMQEVGIFSTWSPIFLAVRFMWRKEAVLQSLLKAKASAMTAPNLHVMGMCRTVRDVEILIQHNADVNQLVPPLNNSIIGQACMSCAPTEVIAKLLDSGARVDPPSTGGSGASTPFANLALYANVNPYSTEVAKLLISARADLNLQCHASGIWLAFELTSRAYLQVKSTVTSPLVHLFAEWTTTPLGFACFFGRPHLVQLLLEAKADPEVRNARGKKPFELTEYEDVLSVALKTGVQSIVVTKDTVMI